MGMSEFSGSSRAFSERGDRREAGLEQFSNSLHAQREACEADIRSQRHEGWQLVKTAYDDGGFSGGTLNRPGLERLLQDISDKKIDAVVVHKVNRVTLVSHGLCQNRRAIR
jgi:DNA invertase Pin-like site-specific DNA recombinase